MTYPSELRLLPWSGPEGKPCYLQTDDTDSYLSRLADNTEAVQLGMAAELLEYATDVLTERKASPDALRLLVTDLTRALQATLRVSVSRGHRLSLPEPTSPGQGGEGPQLPADAFG
ncbi:MULTISPECIES: hypothetical protein [unclassified Streptomyces]|uniref:hypothetical protein n=1 Tax=unclassified Streptomyces TaxID=2593676 RepID=UPI002E18024C